ncbi:MAG: tetratricopeptide repeat protein [Nitrospirae bacterium]|nr:tetratricopeptide repeat protein [Nitrospirota bacterium]
MTRVIKKHDEKHGEVPDIEEIKSIFSQVYEDRKHAVLIALAAIGIVAVLGIGITYYRSSKAEKASNLESQALTAFYGSEKNAARTADDYKKALGLFKDAAGSSETPVSLYYLGESQLKTGDKKQAMETFRRFISKFSGSTLASSVHIKMALMLAADGDSSGALKELELVKGDQIGADTALMETANIYDRMSKPDDAKKALRELVSSFPASPWLSEAKGRLGETPKAATLNIPANASATEKK